MLELMSNTVGMQLLYIHKLESLENQTFLFPVFRLGLGQETHWNVFNCVYVPGWVHKLGIMGCYKKWCLYSNGIIMRGGDRFI